MVQHGMNIKLQIFYQAKFPHNSSDTLLVHRLLLQIKLEEMMCGTTDNGNFSVTITVLILDS